MPSRSTSSAELVSSPKKVVFFPLENVLVPGAIFEDVDVGASTRFLKAFFKFAAKKGIRAFVISSRDENWAREQVNAQKWGAFFPVERVFGVNSAYLNAMDPLDRARFDSKQKENPACTDEYYRQVAMLEIMKKNHFNGSECVLIGHDFWFDGFYTRRYAQIDIVFIENSLTNRTKPMTQKVPGLWYALLAMKPIQNILEGRVASPNYKPFDTWASVTLTEELLGAQNFNMIKRVVLEKKKDGTFGPSSGEPLPPAA